MCVPPAPTAWRGFVYLRAEGWTKKLLKIKRNFEIFLSWMCDRNFTAEQVHTCLNILVIMLIAVHFIAIHVGRVFNMLDMWDTNILQIQRLASFFSLSFLPSFLLSSLPLFPFLPSPPLFLPSLPWLSPSPLPPFLSQRYWWLMAVQHFTHKPSKARAAAEPL